jgi:hypothetical protein
MAALVFAIVAVVIAGGLGLGTALAPMSSGSIRTTGIVTDQEPYRLKRNDYCTLGITFTLHGQQLYSAADSGEPCTASLRPGEQVQLALAPGNPGDIVVLGHGYPREDRWKGVLLVTLLGIAFLGICILISAISDRRTKRLFTQGTPWRELAATVRRAQIRSRSGTSLFLEAPDTTGNTRIFLMVFRSSGPHPTPQPDDTFDFALLADGTAHAAVSIAGEHALELVHLSVPSDFQLRTMGL